MLQAFDDRIVLALNAFAGKSIVFDHLMDMIVTLPSVKILPVAACLVWLWFNGGQARRSVIAKGLAGAFATLVVSRLIQNLSSYRPRPMHTEHLGFVLPLGVTSDRMYEWSSFPSDTTALAFALAATVWCLSRRLGWACFAWSGLMVGLPRIYDGYHYPSDVLCGAILGFAVVLACTRIIPDRPVDAIALSAEKSHPGLFYGLSFVVLYQIVTFFEDIRFATRMVGKVLERLH